MISLRWIPLLTLCCASISCDAGSVAKPEAAALPEVAPVVVKAQPKTPTKPAIKKGEVTEVLVEQVFGLRSEERALLIDTRPPIFFALGHIDGAINVPLKYFAKSYPANKSKIDSAVSEGKVLVVYCANQTCVDSHRMAKELAEKGYSSSVFKGGWELWKETGLE